MQAGNAPQEIQWRQICHFFRGDRACGIGVAQAFGLISLSLCRRAVQLETVAEK
jgi:hypothetical protein